MGCCTLTQPSWTLLKAHRENILQPPKEATLYILYNVNVEALKSSYFDLFLESGTPKKYLTCDILTQISLNLYVSLIHITIEK